MQDVLDAGGIQPPNSGMAEFYVGYRQATLSQEFSLL